MHVRAGKFERIGTEEYSEGGKNGGYCHRLGTVLSITNGPPKRVSEKEDIR